MTQQRKSAVNREKELRLAISRIERGKSNIGARLLSISSVAKEAGVTPALIHNYYPEVAALIRGKLRKEDLGPRKEYPRSRVVLQEVNKALREELIELRNQKSKLASINEMLLLEIQILKAASDGGNVRRIRE